MSAEQRICSACSEPNPARAKFCLECGTPFELDLVDELPQDAVGGERRIVSVLFADLSGFTSFSEQTDVEDVRDIARETADRLGEIVVRYGGTVDKIIGDCVMAVWGAPSAHEDDAERAVRAALDMLAHTTDHAERFAGLALSIGINTGEAMWAPVGDQHTVLGDTVNTAARLQGAASRGEIYVGQATFEATQDNVEYQTVEPIVAKNKREPVPAFKALSVRGVVRRRRTTTLPIVGREEERERLRELWDHVRTERSPYGALVLGQPGLGKSRLLQAVVDGIGTDATVIRGACLPYGEGITYWPVTEMIRQAAGILHDDDHEAVSHKLGDLLERLGSSEPLDELRTMAVALANLVGEPRTPRGTYTATEISKGELHWGIRRILELAARAQPVVLIVEDLHWAEPAFLELILSVLEPRPDVPILALGTARPEMVEAHPDFILQRPNTRVLALESLTDDYAIEMVRRLIGEGDVPEETLRKLLSAAGGNPLFLEEMIQMWVDAGAGADVLAQMVVPSGLQSLISSRLDHLGRSEIRILTHAAVMGDVFWSGALETLKAGNGEIESALVSLEEKDLVRSHPSSSITGQREYGFKHSLIREVSYGRMPKGERAVLHERAGEWLGKIGPDEFAEIMAYHLEESCKLAAQVSRSAHAPPTLGAVKALRKAAEKAEGREGVREAAGFYDRAVGLLGTGYPETAIDLKLRRARLDTIRGELERAWDDFSAVAQGALETGNADIRLSAQLGLVDAGIRLGRLTEAHTQLKEAERTLQQADDPKNRIRIAFVRGRLGSADGSAEKAERELRGAIEIAEELDDQAFLIEAELRLGILEYNTGKLSAAVESFERVADLAGQRGSLKEQASATLFLAGAKHHLGPREEAEQRATQAAAWFERLGERHLQSQALEVLGKLAHVRGDYAAAQRYFTQALDVVPPTRFAKAGLYRFLADTLARHGRAVGARRASELARESASEDDTYAEAFAATAEGCAEAAAGSETAARQCFERGLSYFEQLHFTTDLAEARVSYASALAQFGDTVGAAHQLALAREVFEGMQAGAAVNHIDELLSELRAGALPPDR